jgi:broad specificity phosphatase PhoE
MKTVYFIRHGETDFNKSQRFQDASTTLSEKGLAQADFLAQRFKTISVETIIASHMVRAWQTAGAIARVTGHVVVECDLFHEVLRPSVVHGKEWEDPSVADIVSHFRRAFGEADGKHSDEENFADVKKRALAALRFIAERPEETLCVVTHGTFLKMLMSVMMCGEKTTHDFFLSIDNFHYPSNTGITKCELGRFKEGEWTLHTWNDDAHLGEVRDETSRRPPSTSKIA